MVSKTLQNPLKMIPEKFVKEKKKDRRLKLGKDIWLSSESPSQEQEKIKKPL